MSHLLNIDDATAKRLVADMDSQGHGMIEGALSSDALAELRAYVDTQAARHNNQYFAYHGYQALEGSALAALGKSPDFVASLGRLHQLATGHAPASRQVFPVLRCVQGGSGLKESNAYHYDATLITMLIPIFTPTEGEQRGDLVMFPNLRRVRGSVLFNIVEKAVLQNTFTRRLLTWGIQRQWFRPTTLRIVPGNVYLFWGYRSLHANEPCSPQFCRATALMHYGDPHAGSLATRLILKLNQHRARKAVARTKTTVS